MTAAAPVRFGVVVFPGSNMRRRRHHATRDLPRRQRRVPVAQGHRPQGRRRPSSPGGFSYGDYLRCGAIARFSPIMQSIIDFAAGGGLVMGICNGFQTLIEAGLLPGGLIRNTGLKFVCRYVNLRVETTATPFTSACDAGRAAAHRRQAQRGQLHGGPGRRSRSMKADDQIVCATSTPPASGPRAPTPTAPSTTSPASATRRATCSA